MRLLVEGGSYLAAADSLRTANHTAALLAQSLSDRLATYAGMAGSDASGEDFAASYDGAAAQALAAVADLADAFTGLGVLTAASLANHHSAEEAANLGRISAYTGDDLHEDDYVRVAPASPPSALGADPVDLDPVRTWIVDQIEGWLWPSADVALLRAAARAWTWASGGLRDLADSCDTATGHLATSDSPEIPLALDALTELRALVSATADDLHALGAACSAYAVQVEAARGRLFTLLDEILQMVVEGVVISAAVGAITGGVGAGVSGTAVAARVSAQAPRFHLITDALRGSAAVAASAARSARESVGVSRAALEKFARVRVRTERGAVRLPGGEPSRHARARAAATLHDPRMFDPHSLRGFTCQEVRELVDAWRATVVRNGEGMRFQDPDHFGRQIRIMDGYPGTRPDPITHGPYAVVSQNGQAPVKIPLKGNPTL